jgi:hypothetical protein
MWPILMHLMSRIDMADVDVGGAAAGANMGGAAESAVTWAPPAKSCLGQ